ncbi:hypothetical protein SAMN05428975_0733 [Mucilaginibacter sp. OK268]|nr:hypothetical protein SAMN05428975_0733 [Mucilaginibacter sp. OK268]
MTPCDVNSSASASGTGDINISIPSDRRILFIVGKRVLANRLDKDHCPTTLYNGKKRLLIGLLKNDVKTELFPIEGKCYGNVSHNEEWRDTGYRWLSYTLKY